MQYQTGWRSRRREVFPLPLLSVSYTHLDVYKRQIPYRKAVLAEAVEEERRLFYVGMTRARRKLVLAYVNRQYEKEREPSRFLEETGL